MDNVIQGTTVKLATLVDGTLPLTIEVEPMSALDAFALFHSPGTVVALAAIKTQGEQE